MEGIPGEPHSGQDGVDRCVLYGGQRPFRDGVDREGVCDAWEEDGEVELVGGFCIHGVMKEKAWIFPLRWLVCDVDSAKS
jgi:hypothetical protein